MSPLKIELANLRKRFAENEVRLQRASDDFWRNGGICCPGCGVPGFLDLQFKQERRLLRIDGLKRKLSCS